MKSQLVISRTPKKCTTCEKSIKVGEECVRTNYVIFHHKKCVVPIRVFTKCPYKNEDDFEKRYINKLDEVAVIRLFCSYSKRYKGWWDGEIQKIKNFTEQERKNNFEGATIKEILLDFMKYILITNYKDLGWTILLK